MSVFLRDPPSLPRPKDPVSPPNRGPWDNMSMAGKVWQGYMYVVLFIVVFSYSKFSLSYKECKKIDDCSCLTDEGEISLKKLAETGKPR